MKHIILAILLLSTTRSIAQETITSPISISGYLETYYNYDFNRPQGNTMPPFLYNFTRNNEVNLNLAYIQASYTAPNVRANFTIASGTYMNANYAAEAGLLKNIYEAHIGVRLSSKNNLWLDAGILPSHIGWESAVGKDNPTLSRSIAAENSPYFETGARISYTSKNEKWYLSALLLNGWQRIERINGNTTPAFGTQVTFKPSPGITLNSGTFIGNDKPDDLRQMRYFHDFYGIFQLSNKWSAIAGFDVGAEQKIRGSSKFNTWQTSALILKYNLSSKTSAAVRAEYYNDKNGVIITTPAPDGFTTWGFSTNVDYNILKNLVWRSEIRSLNAGNNIFIDNEKNAKRNNLALTTSLSISF